VFGFGTTFAIATALWGGLARRFGLGRCLAIGVGLLVTGSVAAVLAPSLEALIVARMLQGIGAGATPTLAHASVARMFDGPARTTALGTIVASVGLGLAVGPILGGVALELFGWRGPMAIGLLALPAAFVLGRITGRGDPAARIDHLGAVLLAIAVTAVTFLLNRLPVLGLGPVTVGATLMLVVVAAALVRRSARSGAFIPRRIAAEPAFWRVAVLGTLGMAAFGGSLVLVPVAVARAHGLDGLGLGVMLLPMAVLAAFASRRSGRVQARLGRRRTTLVSLTCLAASATVVGLVGPGVPPHVMAVLLVPLGVGFGLLQSPLVNEISVAFGDADRPLALGLYNLCFFVGGASGGAIATALVGRGLDLPGLGGGTLPGFTTAEIVLAAAPLAAITLLLGQLRGGEPVNAGSAAAAS